MKLISIALFALISLGSSCGEKEVTVIKFTTGSRAWNNSIVITEDSIKINNVNRLIPENNKIKSVKTLKKDWENVESIIEKIKVENISTLQISNEGSKVDAAAASKILIIADGKEYIHSFDDYNPNQALKKLLEEIRSLNDKMMKE